MTKKHKIIFVGTRHYSRTFTWALNLFICELSLDPTNGASTLVWYVVVNVGSVTLFLTSLWFSNTLLFFLSLSLSLYTMVLSSFYNPPWSFPLTHIFPRPPESQGILINLEDSLGTYSRHWIVFESGFLLGSLILADRPLRGLHIDSLCDRFRLPTSRRPLECGCINPRYLASGQACCDEFQGHLP